MSIVGHPDWQPAPRGYMGALIYPLTNTSLGNGASQTFIIPANTLYDVNLIEAVVPALTMIVVYVKDDTGQIYNAAQWINTSGAGRVVNLPIRARGGDLRVTVSNLENSAKTYTMAIKGFNGVPLSELRMPPAWEYQDYNPIAAGATSFTINLPGVAVYDLVGWTAYCDQPFSVICARALVVSNPIAMRNEVVKSSAAAGVLSGINDVTSFGMEFGIRNDGAAPTVKASLVIHGMWRS